MGTGVQSRLQLQAAHLVRPFSRALVWGRDPGKAAECASDLGKALGIEVRSEPDPARLVAESQLVVTTTPAREPILVADWLHPGLHVTAMGSDQAGKNEIDPQALARADRYVADRVSQCEKLGELRSAIAAELMRAERVPELGQVIRDPSLGRRSADDVTIADLTGTGAQDTAIASYVFRLARDRGAGTVIRA
jgi:ornithine cyclodeaminase